MGLSRQLQALLVVAAAVCCSCQTSAGPNAPAWAQGFKTRNNVTFDGASGTATLAGTTTYSGSLAPSAALISSALHDGDISMNVTLSDWKILQSGYQAQVSVFMAPANYSSLIGDYLSWSATDAVGSQQYAYARAKIYTTAIPDYTWASMVVPSTGLSKSIGVAGAWSQKGVIGLSRKGDQVSGFLKVGSSQFVQFGSLKAPTGPVVLGVQVLYGFYYSVIISNLVVTAGQVISPTPPAPVLSKWRSGNSEGSWRGLFNTRNGVSFDGASGAATLAGSAAAAGSLAPSAGLLSRVAFAGDFTINVTVSDYRILQPGYQANMALFMAATNFTLGDCLTWPETDALSQQQAAYIRAKMYTTDIPNYTWASMYTAGNGTSSVGTAGAWAQKGVVSLSRKGNQLSGFLQVGTSPAVPFPPAPAPTTGPVVLGLQMLYGFNYSLTVAQIDIAYESMVDLPLKTQRASGSEASWRALFDTKNGVSFDAASGDVTLAGSNPPPGTLAPSAALVTKVGVDGDFQMNVTVRDYKILQSGYQAQIALFMANLTYQPGNYLSWPETDALMSQQLGFIRAKIYTTDIPNYTWASMYTAGNGTSSVGTAGAWAQKGVISLSRKGSQLSGFLQVGTSPAVPFPPAAAPTTGPVVLGLQMLYGFNYSLTVAQVDLAYSSFVEVPAPPPLPSPSPKPAPPPPTPSGPGPVPPAASCNITSVDGPAAVYMYGDRQYEPMGIGGGGAMSSLSMSAYGDLWLIGTDMGSLYRSTNRGQTWQPIDHNQIRMTNDMGFAPTVGFSADGTTLFFAPCWDPSRNMPCVAKRSTDAGLTWTDMDVNSGGATVFNQPGRPPNSKRPIRYWTCHAKLPDVCYAATTGGVDRTTDKGLTWQPVVHPSLTGMDSRGSFLDTNTTPATVYHATPAGIYAWPDGQPDKLTTVVSGGVHSFAAGRGDTGLTLAYVDKDSAFCEQVLAGITWRNDDLKAATLASCGRLWTSADAGATFAPTNHHTYRVAMAENNNTVVYSTPSRNWDRNYGVRVYKTVISVTPDNQTSPAATTSKVFDQCNVDDRYALWPADKLEYSAVGLDVGYWDGGYYTFAVHPRDANIAGGSENFFLHLTRDGGATWQAPFTRFRDCGSRGQGMRWSSTGLEPTHFYKVVVHPSNPDYIYAGAADIKGIVSSYGGKSWRSIDPFHQAARNSIYGFAFDPALPSRVFIATAKWHDWPAMWYANPLNGAGGIFMSDDLGRTFTRVGSTASTNCATALPCNDMDNDFLAVAYDAVGGYLYAGGHINGIARIALGNDSSWSWINRGILGDDLWQNETIVPDIKIDPDNGDVYMLLTGNRAIGSPRNMANQARTGVYRMPRGGGTWTLLRGKVLQPSTRITDKLWQYPTAFAVDWAKGAPGNRTHMLLTDYINNGQTPGAAGVWRTTDGGATWALKSQADWARDVIFDWRNPNRAYVGGSRDISNWGKGQPGQWGYGGLLYSDDGGETWTPDDANPFQASTNIAAPHGSDPCKLWYATAGAGLMLGKAPPGIPGC